MFAKKHIASIRLDGARDEWRTLEDLVYTSTGGWVYRVRAGLVHDYASTPRLLWSIFPRTGRYDSAAILHDALYMSELETRTVADALFLEAMTALGVPVWKRTLMWAAVRAFGWIVYRRHDPESVRRHRAYIVKGVTI